VTELGVSWQRNPSNGLFLLNVRVGNFTRVGSLPE
jgi:hypothetical protein